MNGYFEYNYLIYEKPNIEVEKEINNPDMENPHLDNPSLEKQPQINTNKQNTKNKIDKDDKNISSFFIAEEHNILTLELIDRGYINETDTQIFYYDDLFKKLLENNNLFDNSNPSLNQELNNKINEIENCIKNFEIEYQNNNLLKRN